jgi:DNA primase catalytic core
MRIERNFDYEHLSLLERVLDLQPTSDPAEFKCLCPFHSEREPSFYINFEKKVFHCFGCGIGGTLTRLLKLLKLKPQTEQISDETKASIYDVLQAAQLFFRDQLRSNENAKLWLKEKRREHFRDRFGLGYAPSDPKALREALSSFPDELLVQSGLFGKSLYPVLRNRITIPIHDENGQLIGFAGRSIDDSESKFLNTRNSTVFHKRLVLFGMNYALQFLGKGGNELFVVEGYFDAMHLLYHQIPAVALMGIALSPSQAHKITARIWDLRKKSRTVSVVFALDPDPAGLDAMINAALSLVTLQVPVRVILLDRDPDEIPAERLKSIPRLSITAAFVEYLIRRRPTPSSAAKLLLRLPDTIRKKVWALMSTKVKVFGREYLSAIHKCFEEEKRHQPKRLSPNLRGDFWELVVSAAIERIFDPKTDLDGIDVVAILPERLKKVYQFAIGEKVQLNEDEEQLYAKLALSKPFIVSKEILLNGIRKAYWHRRIREILDEFAKDPTRENAERLRPEYQKAKENFEKLRGVDTDKLLNFAEFFDSVFSS